MLRNVVFQAHWLVGITVGTFMAFSGLTGGLMAFGPQLTDFFSGANDRVAASSAAPLAVPALYARVHEQLPQSTVTKISVYQDVRKPVKIVFAAPPGPMGPLGPQPTTRLANPYTGELLPVRPAGRAIERFMSWLRDVHQGHWSGPGGISSVAATCVGLGAVLLIAMTFAGLYLRWPRGRAAGKWRSWLRIYPRLKGRAFLFNLHAVLGTCALLVLLMIAHSGAFQNGEMSWYGNTVRRLTGLPPLVERGPPPGAAGAGPGMEQGPPPGAGGPGAVSIVYLGAHGYVDADAVDIDVARTLEFDPATGGLKDVPPDPAPRTFGEKLAANNQIIHEGRIFGPWGVLVVMLAALCLPVFYVTGWMMYLQRRRRGTGDA